MRIAVLFALSSAILCTSCAASSTITAQAELPPTVAAPPPMAVTVSDLGKVKFNGPTTVILGTGNNGTTTDNTQAGQKGGAAATAPTAQASASTEQSGPPWQLIVGALAVVALVFTWLGAKLVSKLRWLPFLGLFFCLARPPAQAQKQLVIPSSKHSYREARAAQRRYNRVKRYHQRQNRRDNRELAAEHRRQRRLLKGLAAKAQTHGK